MFLLNIVTNYLAVLLLAVIVINVIYLWILRTWNYFSDRNVKFVRGLPLLGTHYKVYLGKAQMAEAFAKVANDHPNNKIIGVYEIAGRPSYLVQDIDLIRDITIKDFDYFVNHFFQLNKETDPLMGRALFGMSNQPWRDMRSTLSPLFTGSKMRHMTTLLIECVTSFNAFVERDIKSNGSANGREYEMLDLMTQLTNDMIGSTAFGLNINTLENPNNDFYKAGKAAAYAIQSLKTFVAISFPRITSWLKIRILAKEYDQFFRTVIRNIVDERKEKNIVRNDMLNLFLMAKEGKLDDQQDKESDQDTGFATITEEMASKTTNKLKNWTEEDLVAQSVLFFLAGFTGVATTFAFICYELSINEEIQERLHQEIISSEEQLDGKPLTFELLQKMKYLDMVVSEGLRMWPIGSIMDRAVSKQYLIEDNDGTKILLQPNDVVWIPVLGIHRNPKHYPNPNSFVPERFSDENKGNIKPGSYLPFGAGPRACVASRFALLQLKVVLYYILLKFKIECSEKTLVPMTLQKGTAALNASTGFYNRLVLRK